MMDTYEEFEMDDDSYCPYCGGTGYRYLDGWPVHCACGAVCPHDCPACMVSNDEHRNVRCIRWGGPFWSQHEGWRAHGFYYNGRKTMYVIGVNLHPLRVYAGKAF